MPRKTSPMQMIVQFENPYQARQFGVAALLVQTTVATNEAGEALTQPAVNQMPMVTEDVTDELLAQIDTTLASLGLKVTRRV